MPVEVLEVLEKVDTRTKRSKQCLDLLKQRLAGGITQDTLETACKTMILEDVEKGLYKDKSEEIEKHNIEITKIIKNLKKLKYKRVDDVDEKFTVEEVIKNLESELQKHLYIQSSLIAEKISNDYWISKATGLEEVGND